jgi:hypothetical protein
MPISRRAFLGAMPLVFAQGQCAPASFDPAECCILPESLAGFRSLAGGRLAYGPAIIVPGSGTLEQRHSQVIRDHLECGGTVLLESALGLDSPRSASPYLPYVDFTWPVPARIREFCPLLLKPTPEDIVIATYASRPVALRRSSGQGTLILVGSPVGPALLAADPDACHWATSVLRWMYTHSEAHPCFYPPENLTKSISKRPTMPL